MATTSERNDPPDMPASRAAPAEALDAGGERVEVDDDVLVEDIVIDGMCGVY